MRKPNILLILILFFSITQILACDGGKMETKRIHLDSLKDVSLDAWENISKKKIYFGHQSVGNNIIDGMHDLKKENPNIKLNIVETTDMSNFTAGIFAHSKIGKNRDPKSKIDGFMKVMNDSLGKSEGIAALKLCYVDIVSKTDVNKLLDEYTDSITAIKKNNPDLKIIHFTVPLKTASTSWKIKVKKLLGKNIWEYDDNIKRNEYNELLRKRYKGKEPVFDIAEIESTYPDGSRSTFTKDGKSYFCMVADYSNDSGHLNEIGRKVVAGQLLRTLAELN